ncbi:AIR synthase family protein, partial [candidate division KSB1 bacterium]|nr:AIR synthase family protein [candidate division KSB1 bacterium]
LAASWRIAPNLQLRSKGNMQFEPVLAPGKLPLELLHTLIQKFANVDRSVLVGPGIGHDATVIQLGDQYVVAKTDPVTFVADDIGFYAVNVNANDIACVGGVPRWFLATLLLPEKHTTPAMVTTIFNQTSEACQKLGISLCGGHTEITYGLDRPIIAGLMLGTVTAEKLIRPGGMQPGDDLILTKGIVIEGTSIIARQKFQEISELFSEDFARRCANYIYQPGISVLAAVQLAQQLAPIHALHDPTEGGLATGLLEMARASNVSLRIDLEAIPILPEAKLLCDQYDLDMLGTIASGALILAVSPRFSTDLIEKFTLAKIPAAIIGKAISRGAGVSLVCNQQEIEMPQFPKDEICKLF